MDKVEALKGKTGSDPTEDRLMHSVMEQDEEDVSNAKLCADSFDYNLNSFQPDLLFQNIVKDYKQAERMYGKTIIRELTGYDENFVEKNVNIPEFRQDLKQRINDKVDDMKKKGLLDREGKVQEDGIKLAAIIKYTEEIEKLTNQGQGREQKKEKGPYGEHGEEEPYKKHRFHDINFKKSIKKAIRRGHKELLKDDLIVTPRVKRSKLTIIYAVDASGSMRGSKLKMAKKAGVALAYQAIQDKNDVGLITFTSKIEQSLRPSQNFLQILHTLTTTKAGQETDIALTIDEAVSIFKREKGTKHLILLTDALPTKAGKNKGPQLKVLEAVSAGRTAGITISIIGINLDSEGERLAKKMAEIGDGKLYIANDTANLDAIILEDYETARRQL